MSKESIALHQQAAAELADVARGAAEGAAAVDGALKALNFGEQIDFQDSPKKVKLGERVYAVDDWLRRKQQPEALYFFTPYPGGVAMAGWINNRLPGNLEEENCLFFSTDSDIEGFRQAHPAWRDYCLYLHFDRNTK